MTDAVSGETIDYQYDSLKRLSSAATTGPQWGQGFGYDGFGNLLSQTVTKGSAPMMSLSVNPATNRITTSGYSYDANGNLTAAPYLTMSYDVENRLAQATHSLNGTEIYGYDPAGLRVWQGTDASSGTLYFHGADGKLLTTADAEPFEVDVYFAGRKVWAHGQPVVEDRLGQTQSKYPCNAAPTYLDDSITGLDYARHRYYSSSIARFTTPDPYRASGGPTSPQSWNRYSYVLNDPVNFNDPRGLEEVSVTEGWAPAPAPYPYDSMWLGKGASGGSTAMEIGLGPGPFDAGANDVLYFSPLVEKMLARRNEHLKAIYGTGDRVFCPEILDCIARRETGWDPTVDNGQGFRGMFQMGAPAWADVNGRRSDQHPYLPDVFDPETSAGFAADYLNILLERIVGKSNYSSGKYTEDDMKAAIMRYRYGANETGPYAAQIWDCAQRLKAGDLEVALRAIKKL